MISRIAGYIAGRSESDPRFWVVTINHPDSRHHGKTYRAVEFRDDLEKNVKVHDSVDFIVVPGRERTVVKDVARRY